VTPPRHTRVALIASLGLAAAAPAAPPTGSCCSEPSEFHFRPLPASGSIEFDIGRESPVFEFQSGVSHFQAFTLPPRSAPYVLEIESYIRGGPDPQRARVLYPLAAVLTDDFIVARAAGLEQLKATLPILEQTTSPAYRLTIPFDPAVGRERYLVVFTSAQLMAGRTLPPITDPESAAQTAHEAFLGAAPSGRLRITIRGVPGEALPSESP